MSSNTVFNLSKMVKTTSGNNLTLHNCVSEGSFQEFPFQFFVEIKKFNIKVLNLILHKIKNSEKISKPPAHTIQCPLLLVFEGIVKITKADAQDPPTKIYLKNN